MFPDAYSSAARWRRLLISSGIDCRSDANAGGPLVESRGDLDVMPAYYLMVIAVIGLITGISMKETANRPLKAQRQRRRHIQEAKEILGEYYDTYK